MSAFNELRRRLNGRVSVEPCLPRPAKEPPEPDIEWPGLAADSDGRSIVARSYRDIANAILADQSGADQGEAAQGHQPTWLLPRAVRERMGTVLR